MRITEENLYSEILPNLFISGTLDEAVLSNPRFEENSHGNVPFDACVTLYGDSWPMGHFVREQRFPIPDAALQASSETEIRQLAQWLYSQWKLGKRVAGKCQAGWNRSSLVVALVLLQEGYSADDAISLIREKRSQNALCNPDFVRFIRQEEVRLAPTTAINA